MYATIDDFILRIGEKQAIELTDRDYHGVVNEEVLSIALEDASSQIDGYLGGRYRLPLNTVPRNLKRMCCDIARYRLCSMSDTTISEEIIERYKLSLKELEQLAKGRISLGVEPPDDNEGEDIVLFASDDKRVFSRDYRNRTSND